jgi:hypothetical protein
MEFRELFEEISGLEGFIDQEQDPEEFLQLLLDDVFKIDPLIWLNHGSCNVYTIVLDKGMPCQVPDTEVLFKKSLNDAGHVLKEVFHLNWSGLVVRCSQIRIHFAEFPNRHHQLSGQM